ncbi:MAG: zinc ribbon domain-containing protein [Bacillota bacterium]
MRGQVLVLIMVFFVLFALGTLWGVYPSGVAQDDEPVSGDLGGAVRPKAGSWPERLLERLTPHLGFLALPALVAAFMGAMAALAMAVMALAALFSGGRREATAERCPACRANVSRRSRTCPMCHTRLSPLGHGEYLEDTHTRVWRGFGKEPPGDK